MNLSESYRSSDDYKEILRTLQKANSFNKNFVWQNNGQERKIFYLDHLEIDFVARGFVCQSKHLEDIKLNCPLYVKLEWKGCIFRVNSFFIDKNQIHFSFPDEIKTIEFRKCPRIKLPTHLEKSVVLKSFNPDKMIHCYDLRVRVVDISLQGVGIVVSEKNLSYLMRNKFVLFTELDEKLPFPIKGEILYDQALNSSERSSFSKRNENKMKKIGIHFLEPIPHQFFERFIEI